VHQTACGQNRQKKQIIEVKKLPGREIRGTQQLQEFAQPVSPLMMTDVILQPPKQMECGDG
jgi:hypothetical protein